MSCISREPLYIYYYIATSWYICLKKSMISPESKKIQDILKADVCYSVPSYQRSYDWGGGELQELLEDIGGLKNTKSKELFLGNFIFDVSDKSNLKVVDGQQRLTTISLIFIAIREHAKKINEHRLADEAQNYIAVYSAARKINDIRFKVSKNIRDVFNLMADPEWDCQFPDKINKVSVKRQRNKLKPIFDAISNHFKSFNSGELADFMVGLLDTYVVVINVEGDQDVFSVFERTNARGLDLNIGDLLKNYIFSHQDPAFEDMWQDIIENASGLLPRMLKYFWVSRKGYIQQSNLYRSLKGYVNFLEDKNKGKGIYDFMHELHEFSNYYHSAQSQDPEKVKHWLEEFDLIELSSNEGHYYRITRTFQALRLFKVTQAYPLIFSIFKLYKESPNSKPKALFKVLETIEKFHFVNNVISGRVGHEVEKLYAETSENIYNCNTGFGDKISTLMDKLKTKKAYKEEFVSNFEEKVTYSTKNIPLINYVFDRINNFDKKNGVVPGAQYVSIYSPDKNISKRNYNIEHFLPQSKKVNYSKEEQEIFDDIGNLIVIARQTNSTLSDKSPKEKISIIKSDKKHYGNLRYIDDFIEDNEPIADTWSIKNIKDRSITLGNKSYTDIWGF